MEINQIAAVSLERILKAGSLRPREKQALRLFMRPSWARNALMGYVEQEWATPSKAMSWTKNERRIYVMNAIVTQSWGGDGLLKPMSPRLMIAWAEVMTDAAVAISDLRTRYSLN